MQQRKQLHTRYKPAWDCGAIHPPCVNLYQGCIVVCHVRTFAPSASFNALLRYHSNLFCYVSIFSRSLPRLHHHTRQCPCGHRPKLHLQRGTRHQQQSPARQSCGYLRQSFVPLPCPSTGDWCAICKLVPSVAYAVQCG